MDYHDFTKKKKLILKLFPYLKNKNDASSLLIDDDSIHYISSRDYAEKITNIIKLHLETMNIDCDDIVITDATAGVGGDTISFSKNFKHVNAIEINNLRTQYLQNNITIYKCNNVTIINDDCENILHTLDNHNVIFIDPPWEPDDMGSYKQYIKLQLPFCNSTIEAFCNKLMNVNYMQRVPELIVLKLPINYDILHFFRTINNKKIYYYNLNKMIILVIIN